MDNKDIKLRKIHINNIIYIDNSKLLNNRYLYV